MLLIASKNIKEKIEAFHGVSFLEAEEAFNNFVGYPLVDDRARHKTKPETAWCLSETYDGRLLKLVYIPYPEKQLAVLRTALFDCTQFDPPASTSLTHAERSDA